MTDAMAAGRFPVDEDPNAPGRRQLDGLDVYAADTVLTRPESRARQTAELLGDPRGHSQRGGCSAEVVLAQRCCACRPHPPVLHGAGVDAAIGVTAAAHSIVME
jgi:hypothetical protein